ncbi:hypothetical protein [Pseudomonas sp. L13]|uniref:hypothetical protein n=1 Tax=Pseudomonas sp. L13 TaxID=343985 RepID=UPI00137A25D0|nr:hypothetical protein [Pseudomonas sp. L13]NCE89648.1 hypothetical protein [Pseudomonas sp. L13]
MLLAVLFSGVLVALSETLTTLTVFRLCGAYFAIGAWIGVDKSFFDDGSAQKPPAAIVRQIGSDRDEREMLIQFTVLAIAIVAVAVASAVLMTAGLAPAAIRDSEAVSGRSTLSGSS